MILNSNDHHLLKGRGHCDLAVTSQESLSRGKFPFLTEGWHLPVWIRKSIVEAGQPKRVTLDDAPQC